MRKARILLLLIFFSLKLVFAQSPNLMSYQSVIWDDNGNLVSEKIVNIKLSILQGSPTGVALYSETHSPQTNSNGLVSLMIGGGTNTTGKISDINWGTGIYFLKTETDPTGGSSFNIVGTTQIISVPYSMFSSEAGNISTVTPGLPGQVLTLDIDGKMRWSGPTYPTVTTNIVNAISYSAAKSGGNITSDGGANITHRGIVWSNNPKPDTSLPTKTINGNGIGTFSSILSNLQPNTTYYLRAYATNNVGTGYGDDIKFTTLIAPMGSPCPGTLTEDIDGNLYNTVLIGNQCWFKENLRTTKFKEGTIIPLDQTGGLNGNGNDQKWTTFSSGVRTLYNNDTKNLNTLGYLYNWFAASDSEGLCPTGWHLPSDSEWKTLANILGGNDIAGGKMKTVSGWLNPNLSATNESGFSGLSGGLRFDNDGSFFGLGQTGYWWSSTSFNSNTAVARFLKNSDSVLGFIEFDNQAGFSVRCLKDSTTAPTGNLPTIITTQVNGITHNSATSGGNITSDGGFPVTSRGVVWSTSSEPTVSLSTKANNGAGTGSFSSSLSSLSPNTTYYVRAYATNNEGTGYGKDVSFSTTSSIDGLSCPETPTVKDIDNNSYNTVKIGNQCWTKENLRVTKFRDGTVIPLDESGGPTGDGTGRTWSTRTTGARTVYGHSAANLANFGYLYNWYAVANTKGLCPNGWHVPSDSEWTTLTTYLGGESVAGGKMKTDGTIYWNSPNIGGTNESGFSILPGGFRYENGLFSSIRDYAIFWSKTKANDTHAWYRSKSNIGTGLGRGNGRWMIAGASIRCLKD
jgi:uncharacterized protein (TIGR02145 family)